MMNVVKRIDRALFNTIVKIIRTGKLAMDDSCVDMSPDQTIRISNGKVTFTPPLKVQKTVDVLGGRLGSLNVASTIKEMNINTPGDTIHIDLIASPVDMDIKPDAGPQPQFLRLHDPLVDDIDARLLLEAEADTEPMSLADITFECQKAFGCSDGLMLSAANRNRRHLLARRKAVDRVCEATIKAKAIDPTATGKVLLSIILGIMFPLVPSFLWNFVLSGLQRLILDWLFSKMKDNENQVNLSGVYGGDRTLPPE